MRAAQAAEILDVKLAGLTQQEVDDNFRRVVKLWHPDSGVLGIDHADMLDKAKKARDTLREFVNKGGLTVCPNCFGRGRVRGAVGQIICPRCKGAG